MSSMDNSSFISHSSLGFSVFVGYEQIQSELLLYAAFRNIPSFLFPQRRDLERSVAFQFSPFYSFLSLI